MKRYIFTAFFLLSVLVSMAQQHVTGQVIEQESQEPVAQSTIRLLKPDSTLAVGVLTDLQGRFRVKAPAAGRYIR